MISRIRDQQQNSFQGSSRESLGCKYFDHSIVEPNFFDTESAKLILIVSCKICKKIIN